MGKLPRQSGQVPARQIGVESAHGFGDGLFNAALLKALSEQRNTPIGVAVRGHCADAFENLPWVDEIVRIGEMGQGEAALRRLGYRHTFQITQNIWFERYTAKDGNHSLIDTPLLVGRDLFGLPPFEQRPIFRPSAGEVGFANEYGCRRPMIAVESVYLSLQSWATPEAFDLIVNKYAPTHHILWLSQQGVDRYNRDGKGDWSSQPKVSPMSLCSRRQLIMWLRHADIFFSVGSGFFCAALALDKPLQPKKIVCLWRDDRYRYEGRLAELRWHDDITWVHDLEELKAVL